MRRLAEIETKRSSRESAGAIQSICSIHTRGRRVRFGWRPELDVDLSFPSLAGNVSTTYQGFAFRANTVQVTAMSRDTVAELYPFLSRNSTKRGQLV